MLNIKFTTKKIGALVLTLGLGIAVTDGLHAAKRGPVKRERVEVGEPTGVLTSFNPDVVSEIVQYLLPAGRSALASCSHLSNQWVRNALHTLKIMFGSQTSEDLFRFLSSLQNLSRLQLNCIRRPGPSCSLQSNSLIEFKLVGEGLSMHLPNLRKLSVNRSSITGTQLASVVNTAPELEELNLLECKNVGNPYLRMRNLIQLGVFMDGFEAKDLAEALLECPELKCLMYVPMNRSSNEAIINIVSERCPKLEKLLVDGDALLSAKKFSVLRALAIILADANKLVFFDQSHCPSLARLFLFAKNSFGATPYLHPGLESLFLCIEGAADSATIEMIIDEAIQQCPKMREISLVGLTSALITDQVIQKIANNFPLLGTLRLSNTTVTIDTARDLVQKHSLLSLFLGSGNNGLTQEFIDGNLCQRPGIKVVTGWTPKDVFTEEVLLLNIE